MSSWSLVAPMTVTIASIVAAPALSMTVDLSRSTKRTGGYAASADSSVRTPTGPSTSTSAWASSSAGVSSELTPTQMAVCRRPSAASRAQGLERVEVGVVVADVDGRGDVGALEQVLDPAALVERDRRAHLEDLAPPVHDQPVLLGALGQLAHGGLRLWPRPARRASGRRG